MRTHLRDQDLRFVDQVGPVMREDHRIKKVAWTSRFSTPPREGGSLHFNIRYILDFVSNPEESYE